MKLYYKKIYAACNNFKLPGDRFETPEYFKLDPFITILKVHVQYMAPPTIPGVTMSHTQNNTNQTSWYITFWPQIFYINPDTGNLTFDNIIYKPDQTQLNQSLTIMDCNIVFPALQTSPLCNYYIAPSRNKRFPHDGTHHTSIDWLPSTLHYPYRVVPFLTLTNEDYSGKDVKFISLNIYPVFNAQGDPEGDGTKESGYTPLNHNSDPAWSTIENQQYPNGEQMADVTVIYTYDDMVDFQARHDKLGLP